MKTCWKILGIQPTANTEAIKKAYRDLVKRYHPDKARSPEKVRHYTIRCAEIIEAYRQAVQESARVVATDYTSAVNNAHPFHWPFEHRATAYYAALYEISRFAGWLYLPLAGLWFWTAEYYRYVRVKRRTEILPVAV